MKVFIDEITSSKGVKQKLYIESDGNQFLLKSYNGKLDKNNQEKYEIHGYYTSIRSSFNRVIRLLINSSEATTIRELLDEIRTINNKLDTLFEN